MTFEKASSLGYSGKCRLKVKTSCKGKGGREGEKEGKVRAEAWGAPGFVFLPGTGLCLPTRFLERGPRLPLVGTRLLLRGWTNGARGPCGLRPPPGWLFPPPAFFFFFPPPRGGPGAELGGEPGRGCRLLAPRPGRLVHLSDSFLFSELPRPPAFAPPGATARGARAVLLHLFIYLFIPPGASASFMF